MARGDTLSARERETASSGSGNILGGLISGAQGLVGGGIEAGQEIVGGGIRGGQNIVEGTTGAIFGEGAPAEIQEKGLLSFGQQVQGNLMGAGIGNVASAFGVEPKMLLLVGAAIAAIVIVMVIAK